MNDEDFSKAPYSIGELRSKKLCRASEQSPRDAAISFLRDYDSGKLACDFVVIMCGGVSKDPEDAPNTMVSETWLGGKHNFFELVGLIKACLTLIMRK